MACFLSSARKRLASAGAVVALAAIATTAQSPAQTPEWVWMGGSKVVDTLPVYGMQGVPAATNTPGYRSGMAGWTDSNGNFWLFGGSIFNDLWEYSSSTGEWTWIGGSSSVHQPGAYGKFGVPAAANIPGARSDAAAWTDKNGNFWLFGGQGQDSAGNSGYLNDLWEFSPSSGEWTWMGGPATMTCPSMPSEDNPCGDSGVYGNEGKASGGNIPGGRAYASNWVDGSGNLWLFGGDGFGASGEPGNLNDLWEYSPVSGEWTYISGATMPGVSSSPGQLGVPGTVVPDSRAGAANWIDKNSHLWLFGGGIPSGGNEMNDLWEFDPATTEWTWWGGEFGSSATQSPVGVRQEPASWVDSSGNFWLFGGVYQVTGNCGEGCQLDDPDYDYDLWEYSPSSHLWTYISGADSLNCTIQQNGILNCGDTPGYYSTFGHPGGRFSAAHWVDSQGNPWIYGGLGVDSVGQVDLLSDLWMSAPPVTAPTFNPPAGTYTGIQSVKISDTAANASIYYTTDGTKPTTGSTPYSGPVILNQTTQILQAIAIAPEFGPSAVAATYNLVLPQVARPVFTPAAGVYRSPQKVTITSSTPGAKIYYAINSTPTTASTLYAGPIPVSQSETIEAFAVASGYSNSLEASVSYTIATTTANLSLELVEYPDSLAMACSVTGPGIPGVKGPTGTIRFTDLTTGATVATTPLNGPTGQQVVRQLPSTVGNGPVALVEGDFNKDGNPDVAVANATDGTVSILLGNGDGTFQPQMVFPAGTNPLAIAVGDFNHDGNPDLAVLNSGSSNVTILLGNGDGTFRTVSSSPASGAVPTAIVSGDFNNDGKQDLAIAGYNSTQGFGTVSVLLGNGDGSFQAAKTTSLSGHITQMVAGKFTGSGNLDLVILGSSNPLTLLAGNGDGTFQAAQSIAAGTQLPAPLLQIAAADFNGDGNLDLVVIGTAFNQKIYPEGSTIYTAELLGNGDGTFQFSPSLENLTSDGATPSGIAVGKFDGDSGFDYAILTQNPAAILGGVFFDQPISGNPIGIVAGNFNGNSSPTSFVVANAAGSDNTVVLISAAAQESASSSPQTFIVPPVTISQHDFQCSYSGDANYSASTSTTVSQMYDQAVPPVFSLLTGSYPGAQPVQITDGSINATIYYTTDGSNPTENSTVYTGPITLTATTKLKAIAGGGYVPSLISEAVYTITDPPQFAASGTGSESPKITLSDGTAGAAIYYTTDGTAPTIKSTKYAGPITLTRATTIRAFAASAGQINSPLVSETFNLAKPATPAISWAVPRAITYGQALGEAQLDASVAVAGTFSYSPRAGTMLGAGVHPITVTFTPTDHVHFASTTKTIDLVVDKRALMVSSRLSKVYGAAMPKLSYKITGFVNHDTEKEVSGELVLTTNATAKSAVGSYAITVVTDTLKAANYAFDFAEDELTITKAPLKVEAKSFTMPAGGSLPKLTYSFAGFVNGDTAKVVMGTAELTTTATAKSKPGKYAIVVNVRPAEDPLKAENYSFEPVDGTLTVE